jgi:MerR HTH family regulatory protein
MNELTIGQLAQQAQVNVETIRYYDRRGLLPPSPRHESGYRQYSLQDVAYLQFIRRPKTLGFSLTEMADLLALRVDPETTCGDVRAQAERKLGFQALSCSCGARHEHDFARYPPLAKAVEEFRIYIENNGGFIPNYGER